MARLLRREFLRALVVVAGPPLASACGDGEATDSPTPEPGRYFPQSVASGDPRPTSVVLWTRAVFPEAPGADLLLRLVVAEDPELSQPLDFDGSPSLSLIAIADADGCAKVRVEGLKPGTTYYYAFTLEHGGERHASRVGRTRTAPAPESNALVSFAVVSCQDYGGKYFHTYRHLAEQELDFVLHLGDYVYETADDPSFQADSPERHVAFSAPEEALVRGEGGNLAARSLGNYRDLYRTYRSDPDLQRAHELFAFVVIPDDHEFSNDCHGATATYTDGRENEEDFERRYAADRAWFEYMPLDYATAPTRALDPERAFPDDFHIYRSFTFGAHLELVVTDLRRFRPAHLVPENAFPGAVFMTEASAEEVLGEVPDDAAPYVDIDAEELAGVRDAVRAAATAQGYDAARITGLLSVPWLNQLVAAGGDEPPLDAEDPELARGYAVHQLLKSDEFSQIGARNLVAERPFRALAAQRFRDTDGASERLMGSAQRAWFLETMRASTRTWKVWGNEFGLMPKVIDLTPVVVAPLELQQRIVLTADDWDGAPNERNALLEALAEVENIVTVTGDLHAFFAGTPAAEGAPEANVIELICGSASSTTWLTAIQAGIAADPSLPPEVALVAGLVGSLLTDDDTRPNPHIGWLDLDRNGYAVVSAEAGELRMTAFLLDPKVVRQPPSALKGPLDALFDQEQFRVEAGSRTLERKLSGEWKRWDEASMTWV